MNTGLVITIVEEDKYRGKIREIFDSILNSKLLTHNFIALEDDELLGMVNDYDPQEKIPNLNLCTWITIGEMKESNYQSKDYEFVNFYSRNEKIFKINFSQFWYPMSPFDPQSPSFTATNAKYLCTIDDEEVSPELFFSKHKGEKLLLVNQFLAITKFNKAKRCFLFAYKKISPAWLRKYFCDAQNSTIEEVLDYPTKFIPDTTIKIESSGNITYMTNIKSKKMEQIAKQIFEDEYRHKFEQLRYRF